MRISDKIASQIMDVLENEQDIKFKRKTYLDCECLISDTIRKELLRWLNYDVDLDKYEGEDEQ